MSRSVLILIASLGLLACGADLAPPPAEATNETTSGALEFLGRPDVIGTEGAVVAGHPLAAAAGADVLRRGGNAIDAAVTMAAVLAVVRPHMNGVGGDAFALIYDAEARRVAALNGSGRAGALATPEFFAAAGHEEMPGNGPLSVTVPGAVSAWAEALDRYGTITFAEALEPAIRYAEGFPVSWRLESDIERLVPRLNEGGRSIFASTGEPPRAGELFRNGALAETLRTLAAEGPEAFYGGRIGAALATFLEAEGGHLRLSDFAGHTPNWTEPRSLAFQGKEVHVMPPNSQGVVLLEQLGIGESFPLAELGHNTAEYLHTLVEIKKLAFADRDRWVADPATSPAPLDQILAPAYLQERARLVTGRAAAEAAPGVGEILAAEVYSGDGDTVYLMAVDQWGNGVSWIQSLFSSFGSRLVEPTTGIVLQNRGAGFTLDEGHPNQIAPGKRPFHTLMPVMVTDEEGRLEMTVGTPGGHGQSQTVLQVLHNVYLFGMSPQQAIEAPRFQHSDGVALDIETGVPHAVREALTDRGHQLHVTNGWTAAFGGAQMIQVQHSPAILRTGADPRREGYAVAY